MKPTFVSKLKRALLGDGSLTRTSDGEVQKSRRRRYPRAFQLDDAFLSIQLRGEMSHRDIQPTIPWSVVLASAALASALTLLLAIALFGEINLG